jgi:hypothetical protein
MTGADPVPPSAALLWEACRARPDPSVILAALEDVADPATVVRAAVRNRIGALLWRALGAAGARGRLGDSAGALADVAEISRLQSLLVLPDALARALEPLTGAGLEPVVLKGPAVAAYYPEPGLRPMEDLDLLLPRGDHDRALGVLTATGWTVVRPSSRDRYDTVLRHRDAPSLALELHYGLQAPNERAFRLDADQLWERRVARCYLGVAGYGLPPEEELVMLCAHAGKPFHLFTRLVWIADLAMLAGWTAAGGQALDWDRVDALSGRARCRTVVAVALTMAARLGVDSPGHLRTLPGQAWRRSGLAPLLDPAWPLAERHAAPFGPRFALSDSYWLRARLLAGAGHHGAGGARARWLATSPVYAARRWWRLRAGPYTVSP